MSDGNGETPIGWERLRLADVCQINPKHDRGLDESLEVSFVPMAAVSDILGQITEPEVRTLGEVRKGYTHFADGDVIFAKITPCMENGKAASVRGLVNGLACGTTEFFVLRSRGAVDQDYLFYFLRQGSYRKAARAMMQSGVGQARVPKEFVENTELPVAPLAEQRRIVSKIESLQERSSRARGALSEVGPLLAQFRQSVLRAAFSGRLTSDWRAANPDVEPASELLARIRTERRHRWEQSELAKYEAKGKQPPKNWQDKYHSVNKKAVRATVADVRADGVAIDEVPDGWELVRLGDIANLQAGYAFKSKSFTKTGIRLLRGTNIEPGSTRWTDTVHLPSDQSDKYVEYLLNGGDVVIAMDRPVISTGLKVTRISETDLPSLLLQRVGRFQIEDRITPEFIYQFVQSPFFMRHIGVQATGTQLPHISANDIESAILPLPPLQEQAAIVESVARALDAVAEVDTVLAESESALTQLDQSILAKAFRGELVPQDPRDEPASVLIERIREARDAQTAAKKNGKQPARGRGRKNAEA